MKRLLNILISAAMMIGLAASCEKSPKVEEGIIAEWQLTEMTGYTSSTVPSVYIDFKADKSFEIYQKVGDIPRYRKYRGTYEVAGTTLSGEYSDGKAWGSTYRASFEAEGEILVLTALEVDKSGAVLSDGEVSKYTKASLAQKEKDAADVVTKSTDSSVYFL